MKIIEEIKLDEFKPWGGGIETFSRLKENGCLGLVEEEIEETYPYGIRESDLNDIFWFSVDWLEGLTGVDLTGCGEVFDYKSDSEKMYYVDLDCGYLPNKGGYLLDRDNFNYDGLVKWIFDHCVLKDVYLMYRDSKEDYVSYVIFYITWYGKDFIFVVDDDDMEGKGGNRVLFCKKDDFLIPLENLNKFGLDREQISGWEMVRMWVFGEEI